MDGMQNTWWAMQESKENFIEEEKPDIDSTAADGRYKTLFEQVNAAAFLTSFDGQILEANHNHMNFLAMDGMNFYGCL